MALSKLFQRIFWHNNTTPAINEDNLNAMSKAIDDIDNRVITLGDDVITVIPQIQAYLDQAEDLVEAMELLSENPPYIGQNGNWWVWDTNTSAFVDSGVDASISVDIADITMLAPDATPYVTNTGTATDPVFHLFIPRGATGNGISTIAKTGTSGLVDTYTITMTDGTTSTFTVTNGSGDMNKSVYDPTNAIANAGGMKSAAAKNSTNAVTANSTDLVESGAVYTANKGIYEVMGQNGAKNVFPLLFSDIKAWNAGGTWNNNAYTYRGVTYTCTVKNGYITKIDLTGTCETNASIFDLYGTNISGYWLSNKYKDMRLSGGKSADISLQARGADNDSGSGRVDYNDTGNGVIIGNKPNLRVLILVSVGTSTGVSIEPMIRLASDTDPTYQPYAKTNQQLTSKTDALVNNVNQNGCKNAFAQIDALVNGHGITYSRDSNGVITWSGTLTTSFTTVVVGSTHLRARETYKLTGGIDINAQLSLRYPNGDMYQDNTDSKQVVSPKPSYAVDTFTANQDADVNIVLRIARASTVSDEIKPMISLKSDYDLDPTYVPPAKTNRQLTQDSVSWTDYAKSGAVNVIPFDLAKAKAANILGTWSGNTYTVNNVTFAFNDDGTLVVNTSGATARTTFQYYEAVADVWLEKNRAYKASAFNDIVKDATQGFFVQLFRSGNPYPRIAMFNEQPFVVDNQYFGISNTLSVQIVVENGTVVTNQTIKPIISDAAYNGGHVPYAKTNRELTEELTNRLPLLIDSGTIPANSSKTISIAGSSSAMYRLTIGSIGADKCGKIVILGKHPSVADIKYATFDCDDISASYAATISVSGSSLTITSATNSNCMYTLEKIRA